MKAKTLTQSGLIAAIYAAVTLVLAPISFGIIQFRLSESLSILAIYGKIPIMGITAGCFLANTFGLFMGANIAGPLDILIGTLASLIAAVLSYYLRNIHIKGLPVLSTIPPILVNAVFIGAELTVVTTGAFTLSAFLLIALQVALEQFIPCFVLGLLLIRVIEKANLQELFMQK